MNSSTLSTEIELVISVVIRVEVKHICYTEYLTTPKHDISDHCAL